MKKGFTLIEMMIAISLFALISVFLYKSYSSFKQYNAIFEKKTTHLQSLLEKKLCLFEDLSLVLDKKVAITHLSPSFDKVIFQTSHSLHNRINPYVMYNVVDGKLYRVEALTKEFNVEYASIDLLGSVKKFRIYQAFVKRNNHVQTMFLIDSVMNDGATLLYKVVALQLH